MRYATFGHVACCNCSVFSGICTFIHVEEEEHDEGPHEEGQGQDEEGEAAETEDKAAPMI